MKSPRICSIGRCQDLPPTLASSVCRRISSFHTRLLSTNLTTARRILYGFNTYPELSQGTLQANLEYQCDGALTGMDAANASRTRRASQCGSRDCGLVPDA